MDSIIEAVNRLQSCAKRFKNEFKIPQVIVIGSQSCGKSSILERIIDCDILPKGVNIATRCPIILQLCHESNARDITATLKNLPPIIGANKIKEKIQELTNDIQKSGDNIIDTPTILELKGKGFPTLTLVDLPGIIKNNMGLPNGSVEKIKKITVDHAESTNSIILAISAANVDLANSDSIQISQQFDKDGDRTIHVITKVDNMDQGTNAYSLLNSECLQKSLGVILLANRSQQCITEGRSMKATKEIEKEYLKKHYPNIYQNHGIDALIQTLTEKLKEEIKKNLPTIMRDIISRKNELEETLNNLENYNKEGYLYLMIEKFIQEYSKLIHGDKTLYEDKLVGGAVIQDILYKEFPNDIKKLKSDELTSKKITTLIKNTQGNRQFLPSTEKAFVMLARQELKKFDKLNLHALDKVVNELKQFVDKTINEINARNYPNLAQWLHLKMDTLIKSSYSEAKRIIETLMRCEENDIYSPHLTPEVCESNLLPQPIKETLENPKPPLEKNISLHNSDNEKDDDIKQHIEQIKNDVNKYFENIQKHFIENLPKWIQTLMIEDMINTMNTNLLSIDQNEKEKLLQSDPAIDKQIKDYRDEHKELNEIEESINKCLYKF